MNIIIYIRYLFSVTNIKLIIIGDPMTKKGIMIVGHGSRYRYNQRTMETQAERLKDMGFENVYIGYNETAHPFIVETLKQMAEDGIEEIVAVPFFIASGRHMTEQIIGKLRLNTGENHKYIDVDGHRIMMHFETPFGEDPLLAQILHEKFCEAQDASKRSGIMVIGHGSRLPFNKQIITLNTERLREMGHADTYCAFNEFDEPKIEDIMNKMVDDGIEEIVAIPLFISEGDHLKNDIPPKIHLTDGIREGTFVQNGREITVKYCFPIGSDYRLTQLIAAKIRKYDY